MARNFNSPFYDGYSYSCGELECVFAMSGDGLWIIRILGPGGDVPLFITPPAFDKNAAYAHARAWCAAWASSAASAHATTAAQA